MPTTFNFFRPASAVPTLILFPMTVLAEMTKVISATPIGVSSSTASATGVISGNASAGWQWNAIFAAIGIIATAMLFACAYCNNRRDQRLEMQLIRIAG